MSRLRDDDLQDYTPQWRSLRRNESRFFMVLIGGAVSALLLSLRFPSLAVVFVLIWLTGFFAAGVPLGNFRCPRCGKRFFARPRAIGNYYNPLRRKCRNCELSKRQARG